MSERVLAIDPGEKVGWAVGELDHEEILVEAHGITEWPTFAVKLVEVAQDYDTLIYETFRLRADKARKLIGSSFPTCQCIGVVRCMGWVHPKVKVVSQEPSVMKTGRKVAPESIKEILDRIPKAHDDGHNGSALEHLTYYWWKRFV